MPLHSKIRAAREQAGYSQKQVALHFGIKPAAVSQWETGETAPRRERLAELARFLNKHETYFFTEDGPDMPAKEVVGPYAVPQGFASMPRDVPVYGVAAAHEDIADSFNIETDIADYARRPPALSTARDVYGLYVASDSMEPVYQRGSLVLVRKKLPARPNDDVIIQLRPKHEGDPPACFIKRLVRRTATKIVVEQFNPRKELEFPLERVVALDRVLRLEEVLGA